MSTCLIVGINIKALSVGLVSLSVNNVVDETEFLQALPLEEYIVCVQGMSLIIIIISQADYLYQPLFAELCRRSTTGCGQLSLFLVFITLDFFKIMSVKSL